jgi:hypothetical protein
MFKIHYYIGIIGILLLMSCGEKMDESEVLSIGTTPCQRLPQYLPSTGLNPKRCAFSTSEKKIMGLVLVQFPETATDTAGRKTWQHPSWNKFGWMGPITTDAQGNAYTAPVPVINLLDNPVEKQNVVYKTDYQTGEMKPLCDLPNTNSNRLENVFGLLGLYYDCHAQKLYASSVAGSTRSSEKGVLYMIDPQSGEVLDKLGGHDAMGLCVAGVTGTKRLYFGSSRTSDIYSVTLNKSGKFSGSVQKECTLEMLGPRGDDKARRIRFEKNGDMMVYAIAFNYNLTAPTEKQETLFRFRYDEEGKKWDWMQ